MHRVGILMNLHSFLKPQLRIKMEKSVYVGVFKFTYMNAVLFRSCTFNCCVWHLRWRGRTLHYCNWSTLPCRYSDNLMLALQYDYFINLYYLGVGDSKSYNPQVLWNCFFTIPDLSDVASHGLASAYNLEEEAFIVAPGSDASMFIDKCVHNVSCDITVI